MYPCVSEWECVFFFFGLFAPAFESYVCLPFIVLACRLNFPHHNLIRRIGFPFATTFFVAFLFLFFGLLVLRSVRLFAIISISIGIK